MTHSFCLHKIDFGVIWWVACEGVVGSAGHSVSASIIQSLKDKVLDIHVLPFQVNSNPAGAWSIGSQGDDIYKLHWVIDINKDCPAAEHGSTGDGSGSHPVCLTGHQSVHTQVIFRCCHRLHWISLSNQYKSWVIAGYLYVKAWSWKIWCWTWLGVVWNHLTHALKLMGPRPSGSFWMADIWARLNAHQNGHQVLG